VLATFRNPNGLQPLGSNVGETSDSGQPIIGEPGTAATAADCSRVRSKIPTST
jgi:flagellar hook protein FlgE